MTSRPFFVHDYEESTWIRGETAYYVMDEELVTPMLHGLVACATQEKAETLAAEVEGQVLTFDEVMAYYQGEAQMGKGHHNHQSHQ